MIPLRSPSLSALACHRPLRDGLTLLEVLVAVGLSTTLIVVAVQAARTAARAIKTMSSVSAENQALRSGWFLAMDDVDYWRSHADPGFPWLKGITSDPVVIDGTTDHPYDKQPFRRVAWDRQADPGQLEPHDPASWYRGGTTIGTMPIVRVAPTWRAAVLWPTDVDPTTFIGDWQDRGMARMR